MPDSTYHFEKLYTFDLWRTLIRIHPEFKPERNDVIRKILLPSVDKEDFNKTFHSVDVATDKLSEKTHQDYGFEFRVNKILEQYDAPPLTDELVDVLVKIQELMFLEKPCLLFEDGIDELLTELSKVDNAHLVVISNTGFFPASTMRKMLKKIGLFDQFEAMIFSDEEEIAKPDPAIFRKAIDLYPNTYRIHVGDNPIADAGCLAAGYDEFALVNSDDSPSIKEFLEGELWK